MVTGITTSPDPNITNVYNKVTQITFTASGSVDYNAQQLIWDLNDGTIISNQQNVTHIYNTPGQYKVTLTVHETGEPEQTFTINVTIKKIFDEKFEWIGPSSSSGLQTRKPDDPFRVEFLVNNIQDQYWITLYAQNSKSEPSHVIKNKWGHMIPTWRFLDLNDNDIRHIRTTNTILTVDSDGNIDSDGEPVATSGYAEFYYVDDMPSDQSLWNGEIDPNPHVTLWASLQTSAFSNPQDFDYQPDIPSFSNSNLITSHGRFIEALEPAKLEITPNGLLEFPFSPIKWNFSLTPYTIVVTSLSGDVLKNFPTTVEEDAEENKIQRGLIGYEDNEVIFEPDDDDAFFKRFDDQGFHTGGFFRGFFQPLKISTQQTAITASVQSSNNFYQMWVGNPEENFVTRLRHNNDDDITTILPVNLGGEDNTILYGTMKTLNDHSWFADYNNNILRSTSLGFETIDLTDYPTIVSLSGDESAPSLTPTGLSRTSDLNEFWVTLLDSIGVFKFNENEQLLASAIPPFDNVYFDETQEDGLGGANSIEPVAVDTDSTNNIWVTYTNPLCSFVAQYDPNGSHLQTIETGLHSMPTDVLIDNDDEVWVTNGYHVGNTNGSIVHYDSNGTILQTLSGYRRPNYITIDTNEHIWFSHDFDSFTKIDKSTYTTETYSISSTEPTWFDVNDQLELQAIGGIGGDPFGNVWIIDTLQNKVFKFDTTTSQIESSIDLYLGGSQDFEIKAQTLGDWSGIRWLTKYGDLNNLSLSATQTLSGQSSFFDVLEFLDQYQIRRHNESLNMSERLKDFAQQSTINENNFLFDKMLPAMVGTDQPPVNTIGKSLYFNIANFLQNHSDVDTCNLNQLYSLCEQLDFPVDNYQLDFPALLKRAMDIISVKHSKLWGNYSLTINDNLKEYIGDIIDTQTYMVSAGVDIIMQQKHTDYYELLKTITLNGTTVYPLSSYTSNGWSGYNIDNWGLLTPLDKHYRFFEIDTGVLEMNSNGVINWDDQFTTLNRQLSSIDEWTKEGGIIDTIINFRLYEGLQLIKE